MTNVRIVRHNRIFINILEVEKFVRKTRLREPAIPDHWQARSRHIFTLFRTFNDLEYVFSFRFYKFRALMIWVGLAFGAVVIIMFRMLLQRMPLGGRAPHK